MSMSDKFARRVSVASFMCLLLVAAFGYGLAVERYRYWPYESIHSIWLVAKSFATHAELIPEGRRIEAPAGASRETFTIHRPDRLEDGFYAFVGYDGVGGGYAAWLYDSEGNRLHAWPIDYLSLDEDGPLNEADNPHPFQILRDGSIIVGFGSGDVMARIDACGSPVWIKDGIYHHAFSPGQDGTVWTWRGPGTAKGHYNHLVRFSAETGEVLQELELVDDIIRPMQAQTAVFGVRPDYRFREFERDPARTSTDIFHPNDIEELPPELAAAFPMFEAGDLMLSFRTLNLITVIDPSDGRVKWWKHGPWIAQHDPDFLPDGRISVYSNNTGRGRSEIIIIDPGTGDISNELFNGEVHFSSAYMGKHQYLPNGNVLIVVPGEGRVLEVTSDGKNVMEFNNISPSSRDYNNHVQNGVWVPVDYFESTPGCTD